MSKRAVRKRTVPYASASSGKAARDEVTKILSQFGCERVGFMDDFDKHEVLLAFTHRGQPVQLRASAKGWAALSLRANPWHSRMRRSRHDYEHEALQQGHVAANSILRDWIKGQITAVETGILSFEAVFMAHMLTNDGRTVGERLSETGMLPALTPPKVVSIEGPR
jgi:hypothetical protein